MSQLDEAAMRRPGWEEGVPIALGNGQTWNFPRPVVDFRFVDRDGKTAVARGYEPGYEELVDTFVESDDAAEAAAALFDLAHHLLARNYDLSRKQASRLLRRSLADAPDAEANAAMWDEIVNVALGNSPKPSAVG